MKKLNKNIIVISVSIIFFSAAIFTNLFERITFKLAGGEKYTVTSVNGLDTASIKQIKPKKNYDKAYIKIVMDYELSSFDGGYPNIFQTDDVNEGIRVEFSKNSMGLVYATDDPANPAAISMIRRLQFNKINHIEINAVNRGYIEVDDSYSGSYISTSKPNFSVNKIMIGRGFDDSRRFSGKIYNAEISICENSLYRKILWIMYIITSLLYALLVVKLNNSWKKVEFRQPTKLKPTVPN